MSTYTPTAAELTNMIEMLAGVANVHCSEKPAYYDLEKAANIAAAMTLREVLATDPSTGDPVLAGVIESCQPDEYAGRIVGRDYVDGTARVIVEVHGPQGGLLELVQGTYRPGETGPVVGEWTTEWVGAFLHGRGWELVRLEGDRVVVSASTY